MEWLRSGARENEDETIFCQIALRAAHHDGSHSALSVLADRFLPYAFILNALSVGQAISVYFGTKSAFNVRFQILVPRRQVGA